MKSIYSFIKESNIKYSKQTVLKQLQNFKPLKYNKFYWWRTHTDNITYLSKKSTLLSRIQNGDFNPSSYLWQSQLVLHLAKEKLNLFKDDYEKQIELLNLDIIRYRKLVEDYEKEENFRLNSFYEAFCKEFSLSKDDLDQKISNFNGTILDLYNYLKTNNNE
jgi:hypothetical protein